MDEPGFTVETGVIPLPYEVSKAQFTKENGFPLIPPFDHLLLLLCCFPFVVLLLI